MDSYLSAPLLEAAASVGSAGDRLDVPAARSPGHHSTPSSFPAAPAMPGRKDVDLVVDKMSSPARSSTPTSPSKSKHRHGSKRGHGYHLSFGSMTDLSWALPMNPIDYAKRVLEDVGICMKLGFQLFGYLGVGYKWTMAFYSLLLYAMLLLPGFIQMIFFYYFSPRVIRSVPYGPGPRQRLDLYLPEGYNKEQTYPVVIFITGGAWTIGYKAWGALLGRRLSGAGVLVACLDYRNFPQGNALQMLEDVNTGIAWVCDKCGRYQGDPDNVVLVGQSAGGQLAALALLKQAEAAAGRVGVVGSWPSWRPRDLRAFVGVSGAYDLEGLQQHLHRRGLYKHLFQQIMSIEGVPCLDQLSPLTVARGFTQPTATSRPPLYKPNQPQQQQDGEAEHHNAVYCSRSPHGPLRTASQKLHPAASSSSSSSFTTDADMAAETLGYARPLTSVPVPPEVLAALAPSDASDTSGTSSTVSNLVPLAIPGSSNAPSTASSRDASETVPVSGLNGGQPLYKVGNLGGAMAPKPQPLEDGPEPDGMVLDPDADQLGSRTHSSPAFLPTQPVELGVQRRALPHLSPAPVAGCNPGACMPPVLLVHGTTDNSVPHASSEQLHEALLAAGVDCTLRLVPDKSHTSFLLEGPMSGGRDLLMDLIMPLLLLPADATSEAKEQVLNPPTMYPALCPAFLCWLAGRVCPF